LSDEEEKVARPSYKSEKRRKEIARQKKQEEKRQKRFNKTAGQEAGMPDQATLEGLGLIPPSSQEGSEGEDEEGGEATEGGDDAPEGKSGGEA
jgi:hypothetical protein